MGQEIVTSQFRNRDFHRFERRIADEMALLHELFEQRRFSSAPIRIGLELEAWLIDDRGLPQPRNAEFIARLDSPDVVPELSQFNVEFNVQHQPLTGAGLRNLETELAASWANAGRTAAGMDLSLAAIGILPTVEPQQLTLRTMSEMSRFRALNEQVLKLRKGRPLSIHIVGDEQLDMEHHDVMLEAAATSLQVHYQVPPEQSVRYYNAALLASPVVTALASNAPFLFGKSLWAESRIPLFEQAVDVGGPFPRVSFGSGYAFDSLEEFFLENRACHPVLLPIELDDPRDRLPHVRLHNGTIWRWNRPLIGFDEDDVPHLRVEHRVMPAGPTILDMLANVAFATGLIHYLAQLPEPPEHQLPFEILFADFVLAAKEGLDATTVWLGVRDVRIRDLVHKQLLPAAQQGLESLEIDAADVSRYLGVIADRVDRGQTGAIWQRSFAQRHGRDMSALTQAYVDRQESGRPVHEWEV